MTERDPRNPFLTQATHRDPRSHISLPEGQNADLRGDEVDFSEILRKALRTRTCAWCGTHLDHRRTPRSGFCGEKHYQAFRHRRRYQEDPDALRERSRNYYWANREKVLEKAAKRRGRVRPPERTRCTECGTSLEGQQRVTCGKASCRERRFKRTNPEAYAERERQKVERRREARRAKREGGPQ